VVLLLEWMEKATESLPSAPMHFIFGTALCGSTMMARALGLSPGECVKSHA